jgi:quercetin dioxygenase-like cupin family protein/alkylhydroperoxidase/carboxymuconolactone decarboxylase family protein YurZ
MKQIKILMLLLFVMSSVANDLNAQQTTNKSLDKKYQSIIAISALTAKGDLLQLQKALGDGLDAGLTINEIKEVLVHLYAYCGFPRSLQGINTFIAVLESRKAKGITDKIGREATPDKSGLSKYQRGKNALQTLTGQAEREPKTGYAAFAPVIDTFLKEHLFADIFDRDILTYSEREIVTVSALTSLGGVEPMMQSHIRIALRLGITESQLREMLSIIEASVGKEEADAGRRVLSGITNSTATQSATNTAGTNNIYAKGVRAPATNFTGVAWVNMLVQPQDKLDASIGVVTFEPGARTNWHKHPGGQILVVTEGKGYYQERGQPVRIMQKGDVVKCLPNVEHWHGGSPDTKVTHVAIGPNAEKGNAVWLERVTDEEFNSSR